VRAGRDFMLDALPDGMRRVVYRDGGCGPATAVESALWDRLLSEGVRIPTPRWYREWLTASSHGREEG
jgi:hypothetical protein